MTEIILALDLTDPGAAYDLLQETGVTHVKIGLELTTSIAVRALTEGRSVTTPLLGDKLKHCNVMYDGKFHDIGNTVQKAVSSLTELHPWGFTVHASNGANAIELASQVPLTNRDGAKSLLIGVTVLTSFDEANCRRIYRKNVEDSVLDFANLLVDNGADAIVCSAKELGVLRRTPKFDALKTIVPGIRPSWFPANDQKRVMTPKEAREQGADYLVIGRPITDRKTLAALEGMTPKDSVHALLKELGS